MSAQPELDIPKWRSLEQALVRREALKNAGRRVVLTNGCFDLLHTGHLYFLNEAAKLADALFVALNAEESVRELKGSTRPVQGDVERAYALNALACVDTVFTFENPRLTREIAILKPDVYVKAGDYTLETLNPEERAELEYVRAEIRFLPFLEGFSTTNLIARIAAAADTL